MGRLYYLRKANDHLSTSKAHLVVLLVTLFIPALLLGIGVANLQKCPLDKLIPIWLIIGGSILFLHHILNFIFSIIGIIGKRKGSWSVNETLTKKLSLDIYLRLFVHVLLIGWLIGASILVYPNAEYVMFNGGSTVSGKYCERVCFQLLYVITIILWLFSGTFMTIAICLFAYGFIKPRV